MIIIQILFTQKTAPINNGVGGGTHPQTLYGLGNDGVVYTKESHEEKNYWVKYISSTDTIGRDYLDDLKAKAKK